MRRGTISVLWIGLGMMTSSLGQITERVSVSSTGEQANQSSRSPAISADGRLVVFASRADNLVDEDNNGAQDIFVHDRLTGITQRVSLRTDGQEANGDSYEPSISQDGRCVAFSSEASNLVDGDTNNRRDIFRHDLETGETILVSVGLDAEPADGDSDAPSISADGRYVAFSSEAANLVEDDANWSNDVFRRDLQTGETLLVSFGINGQADGWCYGPSISADGRIVAFSSQADNLVANDANGTTDVFVHECDTGVTTLESVDRTGIGSGNAYSSVPAISPDGHYVVFESDADDLVWGDYNEATDVFLRDRELGATIRVTETSDGVEANGASFSPAISGDGNYVGFTTYASNLYCLVEWGGILRLDLTNWQFVRLDVDSAGFPPGCFSSNTLAVLSADGSQAAFTCCGALVEGDTNNEHDIFVYDAAGCAVPSWINTGGGAFNVAANWCEETRPGTSDRAVFRAGGGYTVTFPGEVATDRLLVAAPDVLFELGGYTYVLLNAGNDSVLVGPTCDAGLRLANGELFSRGDIRVRYGCSMVVGSGAVCTALDHIGVGDDPYGMVESWGALLRLEGGGTADCDEIDVGPGLLLITDAGSTLSSSDLDVGYEGEAQILNGGMVSSGRTSISGSVTVSGPSSELATSELYVHGSLLIEASGTASTGWTPVWDDGEIIVRQAGSTLMTSELSLEVGTLTIDDGGLVVADWVNVELDGTLQGNGGVIDPNYPIGNDGFILPGGAGLGTLTIDGGLFHDAGGVLFVELAGTAAGTQHDLLVVTEEVSLNGGLVVFLFVGYGPPSGTVFSVLTTEALSGEFVFEVVPTFDDDRVMVVHYSPTGVQLIVLPVLGDLDGDGDVDLSDLATLLGAYGTCEGDPTYDPDADLDGSGCIDLADLAALLGNYGTGT